MSLCQQFFQFGSRYWIQSVKLFPLGPLSLAGLRQTCLRELVRGLKTDVFGTLASLLWSVLVAHAAVSVKSDQRVCLVPLAVLLSFDEANSRSGSVTAPPVIGPDVRSSCCERISTRRRRANGLSSNGSSLLRGLVRGGVLPCSNSGSITERGVSGWSVLGRISRRLVSIMIQRSPRVNEGLLIFRMARFVPHVLCELHGERFS